MRLYFYWHLQQKFMCMGVPATVVCLALVCLPYAAALLGSGTVEEAQAVIPWVISLGGQVCFHPNSLPSLLLVIKLLCCYVAGLRVAHSPWLLRRLM